MVAQLYSLPNRVRLRLKAGVDDGEPVPSLVPLWNGANWLERECYDMFGIIFEGHPNLSRMLLPDDWDEGHPAAQGLPAARLEGVPGLQHRTHRRPRPHPLDRTRSLTSMSTDTTTTPTRRLADAAPYDAGAVFSEDAPSIGTLTIERRGRARRPASG